MEKISFITQKEISALVQDFHFNANDFMILERIEEIRFEHFQPEMFEEWEKGTIFSATKQIRWRKIADEFWIVCSGEELPDHVNTTDDIVNIDDDSVILWGQRSPGMSDFPKNQYIELPIPRILPYPIESKYRIRLNFKVQKNKFGDTLGFRFITLSEEAY